MLCYVSINKKVLGTVHKLRSLDENSVKNRKFTTFVVIKNELRNSRTLPSILPHNQTHRNGLQIIMPHRKQKYAS